MGESITTATSSYETFSVDVGRRISTFRPSKKAICSGKIEAYDAENDVHTICFEDDGIVEEMTLDSYRLLETIVATDKPQDDQNNQSVEEADPRLSKKRKKRRRDKSKKNTKTKATKLLRFVSDSNLGQNIAVDVKRIEDVQKGDRIARDFDGIVYFGEVQEVKIGLGEGTDKEHTFVVLFDDGDCYELDSSDMKLAMKLYEACRRSERNDPGIAYKIDKMEKDFNKQKQEILKQLPEQMKQQFLQIGFAQARNGFRPVLFLSPYDVFYPVRTPWLNRFKKTADPRKVPWIVYWYGQPLQNAFSLVSASNCLSYADARERGVADLPKDILEKINSGKKLGKSEEKLHRIWEQIEADIHKAPADRIPFVKPKEDHEMIQSGQRLFMEIEAELDRMTKTCDVMSS